MKAKIFMPLLMLSLIGLVFTSCNKNEENGGEQNGADYSFTMSELTPNSVKIKTTPNDNNKPYFVNIMTQATYDKELGGNPDNLSDFIPGYIEEMAKAYQMTVADFVNPKVGFGLLGEATSAFVKMPDNTDLIVFAIGIDDKGKATDKGVVEAFKTPAKGENPEIEIVMTPGDADGGNPTTMMSVLTRSEGIVSGVEAFYPTANIAGALAQGVSYDQLLDNYGDALSQKDIEGINSPKGISYVWKPCDPDTEYTYMIRVYSSSGSVTGHQEQKTSPVNPSSAQTATAQVSVATAGSKQVNTTDISDGDRSLKKERVFFINE